MGLPGYQTGLSRKEGAPTFALTVVTKAVHEFSPGGIAQGEGSLGRPPVLVAETKPCLTFPFWGEIHFKGSPNPFVGHLFSLDPGPSHPGPRHLLVYMKVELHVSVIKEKDVYLTGLPSDAAFPGPPGTEPLLGRPSLI